MLLFVLDTNRQESCAAKVSLSIVVINANHSASVHAHSQQLASVITQILTFSVLVLYFLLLLSGKLDNLITHNPEQMESWWHCYEPFIENKTENRQKDARFLANIGYADVLELI